MSKISEVQQKVDTIRDVMQNNMKIAIARGDALDDMELKSVDLENNANRFKSSSSSLRSKLCMKNAKSVLIIGSLVACIFALIGITIWYGKNN